MDGRADEGYNYLTETPEAPFEVLTGLKAEIEAPPADPWPDPGFTTTFNGQYDGSNNLSIAETAVIEDAIGGSGKDVLIGNAWSNRLDGGLGNDTLTGGGLGDTFVFKTALGAANVDTITDFVHGIDQIVLDHDIFTALGVGAIAAGALHIFPSATGTLEADDRIRYNQNTGDLFYDPDGNGVGAIVKIATLTGAPTLTSDDFLVVA